MIPELNAAIKIAKEAGDILLAYYGKNINITEKENKTPVTEADIAADKFIRESLKKQFSYPILSEETVDNKKRLKSNLIWIVDPLDGTRNFIEKTGQFTVVIGLAQNERPVLGVVYQPTTKKLYFSRKGSGAFVEQNNAARKISVSDISEISKTKLVTSHIDKCMRKIGLAKIEYIGSLALKGCLIAEGQYDAYFTIQSKMSEWDTCAPELIITEAGGKVSDIRGNTLLYNQIDVLRSKGVIMDNGFMHNKLIKKIQPFLIP